MKWLGLLWLTQVNHCLGEITWTSRMNHYEPWYCCCLEELWRGVESYVLAQRLYEPKWSLDSIDLRRRETFISVISVHAPTCNSPQEQKDKFYDDLQQAVDSVPEDYLLLALGAINARVGSRCSELEKINREV